MTFSVFRIRIKWTCHLFFTLSL